MKTTNTYAEISIKDMIEDYWDGDRFLELCKNCGNYEKLWSCPPYDFSVCDYVKKYDYAYVIGTKMIFSKDTIEGNDNEEKIRDITKTSLESMRSSLGEKLLKLESETQHGKSLYAGSCLLCESCNRDQKESCCNIDKMRYSLESLGFDVSKIAEDLLDIELKWASDRLPEYFTLVSAFLSKERIQNYNDVLEIRFEQRA